MKILHRDGVLSVSEVAQLDAAHAPDFRLAMETALTPAIEEITVDLSGTHYVDCSGLGVLIGLAKTGRNGKAPASVRLLHPNARVKRLLHITQLEQHFTAAQQEQAQDLPAMPSMLRLPPDLPQQNAA